MAWKFRIKICGITTIDDARMVAEAGADAIGLNFYPRSPRCVAMDEAARIAAAVPGVVKVGLFVDATAREICGKFDELKLDVIQLHGNEPPEFLPRLGDRPVVRAFRLGPGGVTPVLDYLDECRALGCLPELILVDAYTPGLPGGTGQLSDWSTAAALASEMECPPVVLAGGLVAENVQEAISAVRPAAVDTASGVESAPGRKDRAKVEAFVRAACVGLERPDC
jgi:phosphoribosylanthranilate isomerase